MGSDARIVKISAGSSSVGSHSAALDSQVVIVFYPIISCYIKLCFFTLSHHNPILSYLIPLPWTHRSHIALSFYTITLPITLLYPFTSTTLSCSTLYHSAALGSQVVIASYCIMSYHNLSYHNPNIILSYYIITLS